MSEAIAVALITGGLSLVGVVITCLLTAKKSEKNAAVAQAVSEAKIEALTHEVRAHNGFAEKIPVIQARVDDLTRRVGSLEQYHKQPMN